jgi:hypothetical protein
LINFAQEILTLTFLRYEKDLQHDDAGPDVYDVVLVQQLGLPGHALLY